MSKLEVFFDYSCPYCLRGHESLAALLPQYPQISVEWIPCEAHPRPERYGLHSDLLARGMYVAQAHAVDIMTYHDRMYEMASQRTNIEDLQVVSALTNDLVNSDVFYTALLSDAYKDRLAQNNRLAWDQYHFTAVPSYRMDGKVLRSIENIGVTKERLIEFLNGAVKP